MIYLPPHLDRTDLDVLGLINDQRNRLRTYTEHNPRRWTGSLRRTTFARAIQGSNSIEGYNASMDDAVAAVDGEPPIDQRTETWMAITGYRAALTYIMQASRDPYFEFSKQFLKSLHFMMLGFDMSKHPGQWRPGAVFVINDKTKQTVYEGPDIELVNPLIQELVDSLVSNTQEPPIIRAAMAHLNLAMIHPFSDGNGRMGRALQTLVLAREGLLQSVFCSIEEWLGHNTQEYYHILVETGHGHWDPAGDTLPWVRFCLKAHHQQAATLIRRNEEYERMFNRLLGIVSHYGIPDRSTLPLFDAALGLRITNGRYRAETEVSEFVASRDLKRLSEAGLLDPIGERRGRIYKAGKELIELRKATRTNRPLDDPYVLVLKKSERAIQRSLPGLGVS